MDPTGPASPNQLVYLQDLMNQRTAHTDQRPALVSLRKSVHEGSPVTAREAALAIDLLKTLPEEQVAREGIYLTDLPDGSIYRVMTSLRGRRYARRLLRLEHAPFDGRKNWEFTPGKVYSLAERERLDADEIRRISNEYRCCLLCGRGARTGTAVIGPVCRQNLKDLFNEED